MSSDMFSANKVKILIKVLQQEKG